jgi:hypothetical protein
MWHNVALRKSDPSPRYYALPHKGCHCKNPEAGSVGMCCPYTPYNLNLAPIDFHPFRLLKHFRE